MIRLLSYICNVLIFLCRILVHVYKWNLGNWNALPVHSTLEFVKEHDVLVAGALIVNVGIQFMRSKNIFLIKYFAILVCHRCIKMLLLYMKGKI